MTLRTLLAALAFPLVSASAQSRAPDSNCTAVAPDSARFGSAPVYAECQVERAAKLQRSATPRAEFPDGVPCLVADLEFVVDESGVPVISTAVLLRATTVAFGAAARRSLDQWRYRPAELAGVPVRQLVIGRLAVAERRLVVESTGPGARRASRPPRAPTSPCR